MSLPTSTTWNASVGLGGTFVWIADGAGRARGERAEAAVEDGGLDSVQADPSEVETSCSPAISVSLKTTFVAVAGPRFVTTTS